jgi:site-specific DNA recombinase
MTAKRAAIYDRLSKDDLHNPKLRDAHRRKCRELAEQHGYVCSDAPEDVFEDRDKSGWKPGIVLDGLVRTVEAVERGEYDCVVVWAIDRLGRDYDRGYSLALRIRNAKCRLLSVDDPEFDTTTVDGFHGLMGAFKEAQKSSDRASARQRDSHIERAEAGIPGGGRSRPFGFEADRITHNRAEAALVREAARRVVEDGATTYRIAADWNAEGRLTPSGKRWSPSTVRKVLTAPRVVGRRVLNGVEYSGAWEPILDEQIYAAVLRTLTATTSTVRNGTQRASGLLRTIAACECGRLLLSNGHAYTCRRDRQVGGAGSGCGLNVSKGWLDGIVVRNTKWMLSRPDLLDRVHAASEADRERAVEAELQKITAQQRIDDATEAFGDGDIDAKQLGTISRKQRAIIEEADAVIASVRSESVLDTWAGRQDEFDGLDVDVQRSIVSAIFARVTVSRAACKGKAALDPGRVKLAFRLPIDPLT